MENQNPQSNAGQLRSTNPLNVRQIYRQCSHLALTFFNSYKVWNPVKCQSQFQSAAAESQWRASLIVFYDKIQQENKLFDEMVFADGNKTEFYIACQFLSNLV